MSLTRLGGPISAVHTAVPHTLSSDAAGGCACQSAATEHAKNVEYWTPSLNIFAIHIIYDCCERVVMFMSGLDAICSGGRRRCDSTRFRLLETTR